MLALLAGLLLTARIAHHEWSREHQERARVLQAEADAVGIALLNELRTCEMLVRAMQSLYLSSNDVNPAEFTTAFQNLHVREQLPSLQGLSIAEKMERSDGTHYVVRQVEPNVPANHHLLGFDISTQPTSLSAANRSRDTDRVVMSAPFRLRQAPAAATGISGIVMRLPLFSPGTVPTTMADRRARARGSLGASFMIGALVEDALANAGVEHAPMALLDVTDGVRLRLYGGTGQGGEAAMTPATREILFGERTWRIELAAQPTQAWSSPWLRTSLFGVLSSLLLGALIWSVVGARRRAVALADTISARYRASEERFRRLNELLPTLVLLFDRESGTITYANQAARDRLAILEAGTPLSEIAPANVIALLDGLGNDRQVSCEAQLTPARGEPFWASIVTSGIELGGRAKWLMVASDTTEQRRLTQRLSYQASHDALTRLPNRQAFEDRIRKTLASDDDRRHALLFIDLDQFKLINDTSGHIAGDQLLVQLSMKMRQQLREEDVLARLGGDEFGVLLTDVADTEEAKVAAERLRTAVDGYIFVWDQRSYMTSASIGGTVFRSKDASLKELLAQVDTACYTAKDAGRNRVHFYSEDDEISQLRRGEMNWVNRIRWALEESRLVLAYQEIRSIRGGEGDNAGARIELLLRMSDEEGRLVLPGAFLPAAERYGLMPRLDRWVVDTALAHFDRLHVSGAALQLCSINLSGASLEDEGIADYILDSIARHGVAPGRVMFEITETAAVRDLGRVAGLIERLREVGCKIALDDFGAGMSSFGYLKNLGIDTIKIDGAFVTDIDTDAVSHSIVRAITEIGHQHGLDVVAEWVTSEAQLESLARLGVDFAQGFGIHQPEIAWFQRD